MVPDYRFGLLWAGRVTSDVGQLRTRYHSISRCPGGSALKAYFLSVRFLRHLLRRSEIDFAGLAIVIGKYVLVKRGCMLKLTNTLILWSAILIKMSGGVFFSPSMQIYHLSSLEITRSTYDHSIMSSSFAITRSFHLNLVRMESAEDYLAHYYHARMNSPAWQ